MDGDGMISKAEAAGNAELMNKFDRADKNRDGKLSRQEFADMDKPATEKKQKRAKSESSSR
jgi:Ca2+-binding EF-hand superfamily protein